MDLVVLATDHDESDAGESVLARRASPPESTTGRAGRVRLSAACVRGQPPTGGEALSSCAPTLCSRSTTRQAARIARNASSPAPKEIGGSTAAGPQYRCSAEEVKRRCRRSRAATGGRTRATPRSARTTVPADAPPQEAAASEAIGRATARKTLDHLESSRPSGFVPGERDSPSPSSRLDNTPCICRPLTEEEELLDQSSARRWTCHSSSLWPRRPVEMTSSARTLPKLRSASAFAFLMASV
jgi:hypothetical protein